MEKNRKRKIQLGCVLGGFLLYGAAAAAGLGRENAGVVEREPHGEGTAVHRLAVDGLLEKETEIDVPVNERLYTDSEAEELFERIWEELPGMMLGESLSVLGADGSEPAFPCGRIRGGDPLEDGRGMDRQFWEGVRGKSFPGGRRGVAGGGAFRRLSSGGV